MTATVLTTTTTRTKRREPLSIIDMASTQAQARPAPSAGGGRGKGRRANARPGAIDTQELVNDENANIKVLEKKRKPEFDEDVEGFQFTRLPAKKSRPSVEPLPEVPNPPPEKQPQQTSPRRGRPSKRQTQEHVSTEPDPQPQTESAEYIQRPARQRDQPDAVPAEKKSRKGRPSKSKTKERNGFVSPEPADPGTAKITLPMADTPVIQRNKDMRTAAKSEKGNRRSSLGRRGRRASSLIDSGASNALPHKEVSTADFYKHIASDLPEPRRMRQLLIWCATRAMGEKPSGSRSEDQSARLAARVIQEELLKDFESNSDLSNWFGREDEAPPAVVVKKPHPKNVQNTEKIKELEEQIQKLQRERHSLNALLRPPSIPRVKPPIPKESDEKEPSQRQPSASQTDEIDLSVLDPSQQKIFSSLQQPVTGSTPSGQSESSFPPIPPSTVSSRLSRIADGLGPTLDSLAAGVHDVELYRSMSDRVSSRVLRICAERLDERDSRNAMHRVAIEGGGEGDEDSKEKDMARLRGGGQREDLGIILGALSRVERR